MGIRLNWPGSPFDCWRYEVIADYFAAFHEMTHQDPTLVLTKQEYIARAEAMLDKIGPPDDKTGLINWDVSGDMTQIALTKIQDPRSQRSRGVYPTPIRQGHCGMFVWSDYNDDFGDPWDFA